MIQAPVTTLSRIPVVPDSEYNSGNDTFREKENLC